MTTNEQKHKDLNQNLTINKSKTFSRVFPEVVRVQNLYMKVGLKGDFGNFYSKIFKAMQFKISTLVLSNRLPDFTLTGYLFTKRKRKGV